MENRDHCHLGRTALSQGWAASIPTAKAPLITDHSDKSQQGLAIAHISFSPPPLCTSSHSPGLTLLALPTISSCHPLIIPCAGKNSNNVPFYHCLQSRAVVCQKDLALPLPLAPDHYPRFNPTGTPSVSKKSGGKACEELLHTLCLLGKPDGYQKRVLKIWEDGSVSRVPLTL